VQILFGAGDVLAQQAVEKRGLSQHDPWRTGRMVLYGGGTQIVPSSYPILNHEREKC
jgi:hypothetical protein